MIKNDKGFFRNSFTKDNVCKGSLEPKPPDPGPSGSEPPKSSEVPKSSDPPKSSEPSESSKPSKSSEAKSSEPPKKKRKFDYEAIETNMKQIIQYYQSIGQKEKAYVLKKVFESESPELSSKLKCVIDEKKIKDNIMNEEDAAAYLLRCDLTQKQYQTTKNISDARSAHFLPPYKKMLEGKKKTYPEKMEFTEDKAYAPLKSVMEKTFDRLMEDETFKSIVERLTRKNKGHELKLQFSYKCGYDVASGQRRYLVSNSKFLKHHDHCPF